ncbi:MAG: undecaprenyldiphospho-muramoylpentapeptide beta-N-acetylglucosaminyltransferase [Bacteroidia bacterium]|nr:undecaprenyldiphospho-muramoylpentapeptide beta-N-acetylglucosaminyltransferase [Bacteroidia bacterium]
MAKRIIISGGGTGGHIFPAISIAAELKARDPETEILFVGAKGGMEMTLVPKHGYKIEGVWISGIARSMSFKNILKNLSFPIKLISSLMQAGKIIRSFKPDLVVGVGGYASGPLGRAAASRGIPLVLNEQNAYPGITNKWLSKKANIILLGNEAAAKHFPGANTKVTGNPVRASLLTGTKAEGVKKLGLNPNKPVVLSLGGSLGAGTINRALEKHVNEFVRNEIQLVWQCGSRYYDELKPRIPHNTLIRLMPFIDDMANAYAAADVIISRAGASTISELILLNKPSIIVPSPNVAEDHQTQNALSLVERGAALMVKDVDAEEKLVNETVALLKSEIHLEKLRKGIEAVEKHDAAKEIVDEIYKILG